MSAHKALSAETIRWWTGVNHLLVESILKKINGLQLLLGHEFHSLSHTKITKHLLRTTQNGIKLVPPIKVLDITTHTRLRQSTTTPDLHSLVGNLVGHARTAHFQETDGATQVLGLLRVGHVAHLVGDGFEPGLVGFDEGDHFGQLQADYRLVDEALAKDEALVGPF